MYFSSLPPEIRQKIYHFTLPSRILQVGYDFPYPYLPEPQNRLENALSPAPPTTLPTLFHVCQDSRSYCLSVYVPFAYTYAHPALDTLYFTRQVVDKLTSELPRIHEYAQSPLYPIALLKRVVVELDREDAWRGVWNGKKRSHALSWLSRFGYPKQVLLAKLRDHNNLPATQKRIIGWAGIRLYKDFADNKEEVLNEIPFLTYPVRFHRKMEILSLGHKLQKKLLTGVQKKEEMDYVSECLDKLEWYDLDVTLIRDTNIHQVLKAILRLLSIPRDEELSITTRSGILLRKYTITVEKAENKLSKELLRLMESELRRYHGEQDEEWLWYQRPTLKCVLALNDGRAMGPNDQRPGAAERVAREWMDLEREGYPVAYDVQGTVKALERAGVNERYTSRF